MLDCGMHMGFEDEVIFICIGVISVNGFHYWLFALTNCEYLLFLFVNFSYNLKV